MSLTLLRQLFRTNTKRLISIFGIITFSLTLFVVITMVVDNVNQQIIDQTQPLVGADIIVESSQPLSDEAAAVIESLQTQYALQTAKKVEFSTNLTVTWRDAKLVQVRWVDGAYPLYGGLITTQLPNNKNTWVYLDPLTYEEFAVDDTVRVWVQNFEIQWIIEELPSSGISLFSEWRTLILPYSQVESTELTQLWSRVEYETLIRTNTTQQTQELIELLSNDPAFEGLYEIEDGARRIDQITSITDEFDRFITIVLIVTFLLVTTTIFIAVRTFFTNQQQYIAILKLLWQENRSTLTLYGLLFFGCFFIWRIVACILWWLILYGVSMFPLASEFVLYPYARWQAGLIMIILAAISLTLPLSTIVTTSPLALLRPSSGISKTKTLWIQWLVSAIWVFLIYIITLGDWIGGVVFVVWWTLVLLGIAWIIWAILKWSVKTISLRRQSNFMQFDGLRSMIAPWNQSILMTIGILITMTALIVISALSSSFLNQLASISEDQPSLYVLNILPEYIPTITQDYPDAELYDSILSRIQWVNGLTLSDHLEQNQWSEWWSRGDSFTREFNVTTATLSPASYLAWSPPAIGEVSLEEWFAQRLGVQLGDTIQFFIQWRTFDLELTSLRAIQRDGSWPFFYVQFPVKEFQDAPKSFFWLVDVARDEKPAFKTSLVEKLWPALSFVDTDDIIETVTDITSKLITVIRILVGCLAVFVAVSIAVCLDAMKSLKTQKVKLYRLLGATSSMIKTSLRSEQVTLFIISLSISALLAWSIVITIFSLTEFLEWSWGIVGEIILLLVVVFLWILWLIKWMYREVV